MIELAIAAVVLIFGGGSAGVGIAWLNDRRHAAAKRVTSGDPRTTLGQRLAAGEIDEAEYARRLHLLVYGPPLELDHPN